MRYPLSYMIYSRAFDALPPPVKDGRLRPAVDGAVRRRTPAPKYAHLTPADRQAIVEILRATKPDLPDDVRLDRRRPLTRRTYNGPRTRSRAARCVVPEPPSPEPRAPP